MIKRKNGIAILVVMVFAFSIATILFFMAFSNTNLAYQNRQTLSQMQAYYLSHSAMQHAKLRLRLLPKEIYTFFNPPTGTPAGAGNPFADVDSTVFPPINLGNYKPAMGKYDLFDAQNSADQAFPYGGEYRVEEIKLQGSHGDEKGVMKMVQDNYFIKIYAKIDSGGPKKTFETEHSEEVTVSRFTGGI